MSYTKYGLSRQPVKKCGFWFTAWLWCKLIAAILLLLAVIAAGVYLGYVDMSVKFKLHELLNK